MEDSLAPLRLYEVGKALLETASRVSDDSIRLVLYAAAAEAFSASILASSSDRRRKRLCSGSTKRVISTALMDARRAQVIGQDELERLKRVLQALRCKRNELLHPWRCNPERCQDVTIDEVERALGKLSEVARRLLELRGLTGKG